MIDPTQKRPSKERQTGILETRVGTILGTPGYMCPEQARGRSADERSDIFSMGAIFHEMLTGRRAFQEDTPIETIAAVLHKPVPKLPARIPASVAQIVCRCVAKDPRRRYARAQELVIALRGAARRNLA